MKQLYEYTDNTLLLKEHLFPYLTHQICKYNRQKNELGGLRCVSKGLQKCIDLPLHTKCQTVIFGNKTICSVHCKAYPIYQYINNHYATHLAKNPIHQYFHFKRKCFADIFKETYITHIARNVYKRGHLHTCCGGKGFVLKSWHKSTKI